MIIGGINFVETAKLKKKIARKEKELRRHSDSILPEDSNQLCNSRSYYVEKMSNDSDTSIEEDTVSKSHYKHDLLTSWSKQQKGAITVRLPSLDGATTGPKCFSGPIGKSLETCTELSITSYEPISLLQPLPHLDVKDLSSDQQYLRQMCQAVSKGQCPSDLALQKPGPLTHSIWLQLPTESCASMLA